MELYKERYDMDTPDSSLNLLQLMVDHNKKLALNKNTEGFIDDEDVIGNLKAFQFASIDTTKQTTKSGFAFLANSQNESIDRIYEMGVDSVEDRMNNKYLEWCINEVVRLFNPAFDIFPREVIKDGVVIDGIKIRKGDQVMSSVMLKNRDEYVDPKKFLPERFDGSSGTVAW